MIDGPPVSPHVSIGALFRAFLIVGVSGFGGVLPFAHRMLVGRRCWLTEREFTEALSLSQFLPGPNIINLSVIVGRCFQGTAAAIVATVGLLLLPLAIVFVLATLFTHFAHIDAVRGACSG